MKNPLRTALAAMAFVMVFSGIILAVPYTWTDTITFNPQYIGNHQSFPYAHDLTDNTPIAFDPSKDTIFDYSLRIAMHDDGGRYDGFEFAFVDQPGLLGDGLYNFSLTSQVFRWSVAGLIQLNNAGQLDIRICSLGGDFLLDSSTLTARGDSAPVPEPATMLLLGSGLLGLSAFRKKIKK